MNAPRRVDRQFLQRLGVARNNEWALLSTLKWLGVVEEDGSPALAYRNLQSSETFQATLQALVLDAYAPLFEAGGQAMSAEELRDYFAAKSSPSQAKNAARFFREIREMAGLEEMAWRRPSREPATCTPVLSPQSPGLAQARATLMEKFPPANASWSASDYVDVCNRFLDMLRVLGEESR